MPRSSRRDEILSALALMLEQQPGSRITTAALAGAVGVSEAALYRHFPSKARMFDGLIDFVEESLFPRIGRLSQEQPDPLLRCGELLRLLLLFAEKNPGFARLLIGDALQGEHARLRVRVRQIFDRFETELRSWLREWSLTRVPAPQASPATLASLLLAVAEGRISQFVRSEYQTRPSQNWDEHWRLTLQAVANA
ncbi:MAG: nucleoid occlusion factor SlmA [Pseudomonadota bacterium]